MNRSIVTFALLFSIISLWDLIGQGVADTPQNRRREAERYLQATPPKALFADLAEKGAMNLPPEDRQKFKDMMSVGH
jgi:hypothetical protein